MKVNDPRATLFLLFTFGIGNPNFAKSSAPLDDIALFRIGHQFRLKQRMHVVGQVLRDPFREFRGFDKDGFHTPVNSIPLSGIRQGFICSQGCEPEAFERAALRRLELLPRSSTMIQPAKPTEETRQESAAYLQHIWRTGRWAYS